ncbi:alpha/beta hydrolase [Streptomyces sp. NPDC052015]|uniref:alpha/beta fold hydrolase n=1 Tax=Streptomyces sp. NPDC052015 TaxID=3154755 RepID=UPI0034173C9A
MPTFTAPDGTELAYHVRGEGDPLVVLPGGPMKASSYLGDLGGLTAHRRLILLDLRGTGDSAVPADPVTYRCDRQVDDVEALRVHLGLERMDLLAHSAGGSLAMLYAARCPQRVARLVLVTCIPWALGRTATPEDRLTAALLRKDEPWFPAVFPAFEAWLTGAGDLEDDDFAAFGGFFYGRWDDTARAHAAAMEEGANLEAEERFHEPGAYDPPALRPAPARVTAPVLVLAGEADGGPRPELARVVADAFPNPEFVVQPGAGHYPWLDDPKWFVRRTVAFLDGTDIGTGTGAATGTGTATGSARPPAE